MLREVFEAGRPIERMAREQGYEIHDAPHCRDGFWVQIGTRVLIFAPTWARGVAAREGAIARQMTLYGLAVCSPARFGSALRTMRAVYAARLAGAAGEDARPPSDLSAQGMAAD